jgi:hypothetical protein
MKLKVSARHHFKVSVKNFKDQVILAIDDGSDDPIEAYLKHDVAIALIRKLTIVTELVGLKNREGKNGGGRKKAET